MKAIEKLKAAMNTNKGNYSSKKAKFKKYYASFIKKPRKKLKTATSALQVKMIASRRNIQSLSNTLDSLVVATATLPEGDKKGEAQKKVDSLIKGIIDKHEVIEANKVLVTFAKNLLDDAKRATSKPAKIVKSIGNNAKKTKNIAKGIKNAIKYSEEGVVAMQDIIDLFV